MQIENQIQQLIQQRGAVFNEWAKLIKQNDREKFIKGENSANNDSKAEELLQQHTFLKKEILSLIQKADNFNLEINF